MKQKRWESWYKGVNSINLSCYANLHRLSICVEWRKGKNIIHDSYRHVSRSCYASCTYSFDRLNLRHFDGHLKYSRSLYLRKKGKSSC